MTNEPNLAGLPAQRAIPLLVERHGGQLYRLALRFCGTPDDAEESVSPFAVLKDLLDHEQ